MDIQHRKLLYYFWLIIFLIGFFITFIVQTNNWYKRSFNNPVPDFIKRNYLVGILKNKNPNKLMQNFKGIFKKLVTFKIPEESNALSSLDLKKIAEREGFKTLEAKDIKDAFIEARNK